MTIKIKPYQKRKSRLFLLNCYPTDAEIYRELCSKLPVNNEEEDKVVSALSPFPDITRKA